ncbi:hypothetical protein ASD12_03350 [Mesorhizobium sp. Root102]|nr:hypothetical protein ASD12_03350 [Mesorhizobium sp. Root102]
MTFPFRLCLWSFGKNPESQEISLPGSGFECGNAHIGGAKSIRLDDGRQPRRSASAVRNWTVLVGMGYDDRPAPPTYEMLFDVMDTGFGRRTSRCEIAP